MNRMVAYCGLVCSECPAYIATQNNDEEGRRKTAEKWSEELGITVTAEDCICDGCLAFHGRLGGYCGECPIRACGIRTKVENCAHCEGYPCEQLEKFLQGVPAARAVLDAIRGGRSGA
ncbi:MAG: DUF3795 domain-containing protein [Bacillota bacterium]|nr:DUF3795 domain-containing protein [Bacillota bacterium]